MDIVRFDWVLSVKEVLESISPSWHKHRDDNIPNLHVWRLSGVRCDLHRISKPHTNSNLNLHYT